STPSSACACTTPSPPNSPRGSVTTGTSRTRSTGFSMLPTTRTAHRPAPAPAPKSWPPSQRRHRRPPRHRPHQHRRHQPLPRPRQPPPTGTTRHQLNDFAGALGDRRAWRPGGPDIERGVSEPILLTRIYLAVDRLRLDDGDPLGWAQLHDAATALRARHH